MSRYYFPALILFVALFSPSAIADVSHRCQASNWTGDSANDCGYTPGNTNFYPSSDAACQGKTKGGCVLLGDGHECSSFSCRHPMNHPVCSTQNTVANGTCGHVTCASNQVFVGPGLNDCGCPAPATLESGSCVCPGGMNFSNGQCVCPAGQVFDGVVCKSHDDFCDAQYLSGNTRVLNSSAASTCQQFTSEDSQIVKCAMTKRGFRILPSGGGIEYAYAGHSCALAESSSTSVPDGCVQVNGINTCVDEDSPDDDVCGSINGQDVCFGQDVPTEGCLTFADGSMICAENAPTPPSPDNGVPGEEAEPDAELTLVDDTIPASEDQQYFTSITVGGSSGEQTGGAAGEGDGTQGVGACDPLTQNCCVGDECDDNISGGTNCTSAPQCTGSPIQCYHSKKLWEVRCALDKPSESLMEQTADESLGGNPAQGSLIPEIDELDASAWFFATSPSTECPADLTFTLVGDLGGTYTIPFSQWCPLLHVIGLFVLVSAALGAIRIYTGGFV